MISATKLTMGLDQGDRHTHYCVLDENGKVIDRGKVLTRAEALREAFAGCAPRRVVLEAGTHSPWTSRLLKELGHEVIVSNARKLRAIYSSDTKTDRVDAEMLARLGRVDPQLLAPIEHRGVEAQADLARIRARYALVRARTLLINHVRGAVKSFGGRIPKCSSGAFPTLAEYIPAELWSALSPVLDAIGGFTRSIRKMERDIERVADKKYPETERLRQIHGVGPITALSFVLTIDDKTRFKRSRDVGAYFGLRPKQDQSGDLRKQLGITKSGDSFMRSILVQSAQYMLGPFGRDCDLRRWGHELAKRGAKNGKKRAVVAVARKLAVLLHRLLVTGFSYEPLRNARRRETAIAATATP
jgi:transposase